MRIMVQTRKRNITADDHSSPRTSNRKSLKVNGNAKPGRSSVKGEHVMDEGQQAVLTPPRRSRRLTSAICATATPVHSKQENEQVKVGDDEAVKVQTRLRRSAKRVSSDAEEVDKAPARHSTRRTSAIVNTDVDKKSTGYSARTSVITASSKDYLTPVKRSTKATVSADKFDQAPARCPSITAASVGINKADQISSEDSVLKRTSDTTNDGKNLTPTKQKTVCDKVDTVCVENDGQEHKNVSVIDAVQSVPQFNLTLDDTDWLEPQKSDMRLQQRNGLEISCKIQALESATSCSDSGPNKENESVLSEQTVSTTVYQNFPDVKLEVGNMSADLTVSHNKISKSVSTSNIQTLCKDQKDKNYLSNVEPKKEKPKFSSEKAVQEEKMQELKNVTRGLPVSGRWWKKEKTRFRTIFKDATGSKSWAKKMQIKKERGEVLAKSSALQAERKRKRDELNERRKLNKIRREENARKSEIVQVISDPRKLKKMKKKQLRYIETRDTTGYVKQNAEFIADAGLHPSPLLATLPHD